MPINYTCPHCGAATEVADQYVGQSGPCAQCGKMVTIPLPGGMSSPTDAGRPVKQGMGTGAIIAIVLAVVLVVVLVCGGILTALLVPAMQATREAARRAQCSNNLRQIGLALLSYESQYRRFPPAFIPDKDGKPMHSWRVLMLPYLERQDLYDRYRFDEPWDSPHNKALAAEMPREFACPDDTSPGSGMTSYAMLVGPHAFSPGPKGRSLDQINNKDGATNTIMVVEAADAHINWMEPRDIDAEQMQFRINGSQNPSGKNAEISSRHPYGANVVFCDGHVQFIPASTDPKNVKAMTTFDGGEPIESTDF